MRYLLSRSRQPLGSFDIYLSRLPLGNKSWTRSPSPFLRHHRKNMENFDKITVYKLPAYNKFWSVIFPMLNGTWKYSLYKLPKPPAPITSFSLKISEVSLSSAYKILQPDWTAPASALSRSSSCLSPSPPRSSSSSLFLLCSALCSQIELQFIISVYLFLFI